MGHVTPFTIEVAEEVLDDLRARLRNTRWPEAELVDDWSQGTPLSYVQAVCEYWANDYDWRAREALLNRFDQFTTPVEGLTDPGLHFVHVRSPHPDAMPLLISHGWPGSIVEFHKVIEPLTDPTAHGGDAADAFHVVAPSLPGFGFSGKPTATGWGVQKIGEVFAGLMAELGYDRYVAQGGDWGSAITTAIGGTDVDHCSAIHVTLAMGARPKLDGAPTPEEQRGARRPGVLRGVGLRVLEAAVDASAVDRLRTGRLAGGPGGVDPREVLGLDRLRRAPRERTEPRRAPRQRDAVLDQRQRRLVGSHLLGEFRQGTAAGAGDDPVGIHGVPEGDRAAGAGMGRGRVHRHPLLERAASRWPLQRIRGAGPLRGRSAGLLRSVPLRSCLRPVT